MSWDIDNFTPGAMLEFKKGIDKGLWKILEVRTLSDGKNTFYRATIDKDLDTPGNEKIVEWHENEPLVAYVFDTFSSFDIDDASEWPPPEAIILDEDDLNAIEYKTMDKDGFIAVEEIEDDEDEYEVEFTHYEYNNDDETAFLSIWNEDDEITMYVGYSIEVGFIDLI